MNVFEYQTPRECDLCGTNHADATELCPECQVCICTWCNGCNCEGRKDRCHFCGQAD